MWTTGATHMIARLTGSTLFANYNLATIFTLDHRSVSTTSNKTPSSSDNDGNNLNLITRLRELRARSPYALFVKDNYSEISAKYPDLKLVEVSKKVAEAWKSLSDEKKQTYSKTSQDQKANYQQAKKNLSANDLQTVDADEKARRIEHRFKKSIQHLPTKKPRSAYVHFLTTLDRGNADITNFIKNAAQQWSQMTAQDKQKYEDLRQEEKQKYVKALVAWDSAHEQTAKPTSRRSSSLASPKTKNVTAKKTRGTSATGKSAVKKRTSDPSKSVASAKKSTKTKSTQTKSDKESSSSSDDE